jgi:hypothetical protein
MNTRPTDSQLADALERCTLDPSLFTHEAHLRVAFHFLRHAAWLDAVLRMRSALQSYASKLGKPKLYHETITLAYMALIAERMAEQPQYPDAAAFLDANPDLRDRKALLGHYSAGRLASQRARDQFVLGDLHSPT